jgi:hypothetical protein
MNHIERRQNRSSFKSDALRYQLEACRARAALDAMVVADADGLCVAASGDSATCEEVAVRTALVGRNVPDFQGTVLTDSGAWDAHVRAFEIGGEPLYVCAIGGDADDRADQIAHSVAGATRILTA